VPSAKWCRVGEKPADNPDHSSGLDLLVRFAPRDPRGGSSQNEQ
jgi:hypothetical protein